MTRQDKHKRTMPRSTPRPADVKAVRQQETFWQRVTHFLSNTKNVVLTIGALAAAVSAVLVFWPKPPPARTVHFGKVSVYPGVDLNEYEARFATHAVGQVESSPAHSPPGLVIPYRLARAASSIPTTEPTAATSESTTAHSASSTTTGETSTTSTTHTTPGRAPHSTSTTTTTNKVRIEPTKTSGETTSTVPPTSSTPFKEIGGVPTREGTGAPPKPVHAAVETLSSINVPTSPPHATQEAKAPSGQEGPTSSPPHGEAGAKAPAPGPPRIAPSTQVAIPNACNSSSCAVTPLLDHALTYDPNPIDAARAVAAAFADSRGQVINHKLYPSGVAVNYTVDLVGFAHREAILEWSLWSEADERPLPSSWLRHVIAKEIKPQVEDESFSGQFWIPAPLPRGDYVVHLTMEDSEGLEYGETETEPPFH